ncbi:hypothetical protein OIO90_001447 [Microbotryomycetes sp. JL221]|nr:hypothetical protein OIO90_001447 [Microbotryomycetes sp. JL221]
MSLLFALVARGSTILCEHDAAGSGNAYAQATQTILSKIPPNDSKLTYAADNLLIHHIKTNNVVVMVIAQQEAGRRVPFAFLAELMKRASPVFNAKFNIDEIEDAPAYGMNSFASDIAKLIASCRRHHTVLGDKMTDPSSLVQKQYEENPPNDPIKAAQSELAGVKDIMVKNIDAVLSRGERIELLVDKTDQMSAQARAFRKRTVVLRRKMWWKNVKVLIAIGISVVLTSQLL